MGDILKEAIADAKAVRETALQNAKNCQEIYNILLALLMANMSGRTMQRTPVPPAHEFTGGFAARGDSLGGPDFIGPAWFTEGMKDIY